MRPKASWAGLICRTDQCFQRQRLPYELRADWLPGAAKSHPIKLFAVFSATALKFDVNFYIFLWRSYLQLIVKRHLIIFKYTTKLLIFSRDHLAIFARWKGWRETQQNSVTEATQWTICGGAENAGPENAGPENAGPNRRAWKCRTWKWRTF